MRAIGMWRDAIVRNLPDSVCVCANSVILLPQRFAHMCDWVIDIVFNLLDTLNNPDDS